MSGGVPLRVLHFIDNLGPGGKERQLVELLKGLEAGLDTGPDPTPGADPGHRGGCDSCVVSMTEGVFYAELLALRRVTLRSLIRRSRKDWRAFAQFYREVREFAPDVIVAWDHMTAIYAVPAALWAGVPLVNAMIRDAPDRLSWTAWSRARLSFPFCRLIVANSQAGLDAYGVRGAKARVIANGIDASRLLGLEETRAVRQRLGLGDALVVGMVSTFRPWKDQPTLVRAAELVLGQNAGVVFLFIGDGETRAACQSLVAPALTDRIRFLGGCADGIESLVNVLDIGVLATFTEGLSNSIMEYMALAKPVVATDGGGTRELVIDGVTGFLVPARDACQLADRLLALLDDPALRRQLGNAGQRRVLDGFSLARMVAQQLALYTEAAGLGGRG